MTEQRNNILDILEDNTDKIPEGIYLSIMNELKNIKDNNYFENVPTYRSGGALEGVVSNIMTYTFLPTQDINNIPDTDDYQYKSGHLTRSDYVRLGQLNNDNIFVINPKTGRKVLKHSPIGRSIIDDIILKDVVNNLKTRQSLETYELETMEKLRAFIEQNNL